MISILSKPGSKCVLIKRFLFFLLLCSFTNSAFAQIRITVQIIPPYRYRITDYTSHPEQILITLLNTTTSEQRLQLRGVVSGDNGIEMRVQSSFRSASPLVMSPGEMKVLNGGDFTSFFDLDHLDYVGITSAEAIRGNGLPEANYRLCIRAYNYDTNVPVSAEEPIGCSNNFSVTNLEPPLIIAPMDAMEITNTSVQLVSLSWSTPPGAPPTTWYRVRIVEIIGNRNPNDAIMSATQPYFFEKEVMGNMYVYSPADPQLTLGRRYAMMVTAFDPNGFTNFRNNGQSTVTNFKYGVAPANAGGVSGGTASSPFPSTGGGGGTGSTLVETTTPVVPVNSILQGKVTFAYASSEQTDETGTSTLTDLATNAAAESITSLPVNNPTPGTTKYNLNNGQVTLYGTMFSGESIVLGTAQTASDGTYSISFNTVTADMCQGVYIIAKHTDNQLYPVTQTVKLVKTSTNSYDTNLGTTILQIISMQVKPLVLVTTGYPGLTLNFLLNQAKYNASPVMKAVFGNSPETITYNNVSYVVLAKRSNGNTFKRLFRSTAPDDYLVQVSYPSTESVYYPLGTLPVRSTSDTAKIVTRVTKNFVFNVSKNQIDGIVTFSGIPQSGSKVTATIQTYDLRPGVPKNVNTVYTAITDASGYFKFAELPWLLPRGIVKLSVTDTRIMESATEVDAVIQDGQQLQTKNIALKKLVATIIGRIKFSASTTSDGIENALVTLRGTNISARTTKNGYFTLKVPYPVKAPSNKLDCYADGYVDKEITFYMMPATYPSGGYTASTWQSYLWGLDPLKYQSKNNITADLIGIGTGQVKDIFPTYFSAGEEVKGSYVTSESDTKLIPTPSGSALLEFSLSNKKIVGGKVTIDGKEVFNATDGVKWSYTGTPGMHGFVIEPVTGGALFMKVSGIFQIVNGVSGLDLKVILTPALVITGVISDKDKATGLSGAKVYVDGLPYEAITDANGKYVLTLPAGKEYTVSVVHPSYIAPIEVKVAAGETSKAVDFPVQFIDPDAPRLQTFAGFPVTITKIKKISAGNFEITGSLTVASNGLYTVEGSNANLTFSNVPIKAKATDISAVPLGDVTFKESVMNVKAFGLAQIEVQGNPFIKIKSVSLAEGTKFIVGGDQLVLRLSSSSASDNLPISLPDAVVKDSLSTRIFNYVFCGSTISELSSTRKLKIRFLEAGQSFASTILFTTPITGNLEIKAGAMGSLMVNKNNASLSSTGYSLRTYFQLPTIAGLIVPENTANSYQWFNMKPTNLVQTSMGVSGNPFTATMHNFRLVVSKMDLSGLGTNNPNLSMSGKISLLQGNEENGTMIIKSLSLTTQEGSGTTLAGVVLLPASGLTMNGLTFKTTGNNGNISLSYNFGAGSFEFKTSGSLDYTAPGGSAGIKSVLTGVFPMVINKFQLSSKNWDLYMVASPNAVVDLKVAKINIKTLLVNIGYGISMKDMAKALTDASKPVKLQAADKEQLTGGQATWAIGINGGINFPIEGFSTTASASFVVGNVGSGPEIMLNEFALEMKTAGFTVAGKVKLQFDDEKQGFEANSTLKMATKEFGASFKYYSYAAGGFQLGASITTNAGVATGPIMWHNIGGGFDIDTRTRKYDVFLKGSLGPLGVPKTVAMVKDATVGILFDNTNCNDNPVIYGSGVLVMKDKPWGTMEFKADFCKTSLLITVKSANIDKDVTLLDGVNTKIEGVIYALAPKPDPNFPARLEGGSLFFGFNARAYAGALLNGNAFVALGFNFNKSTPGAPEVAIALLSLVKKDVLDSDGTMNAIYLKGTVEVPNFSGRLNAEIAGFKAFGFYFKYVSSGDLEMYYKTAENKFYAKSAFSSSSDVRVTLLGMTLGAMGALSINLEGGYDGTWFLRGSSSMATQFYSDDRASCNSINITFCSPPSVCPCFSYYWGIPYPNGSFNCSCGSNWVPCGVGFKLCLSVGADFNVSSAGSSVNIRLN
ncbi:carboxypeptidase-like regulatory domain-containing protein [Arcicella aquatica]|uniref:Carboxypeptidase-like regulatory domain-containing protein n=1 Tax=Arcicella aquatica TaxID=217141 RepID=A0ABU5QUG9_9BACT|nr:carboxypeptidase regulatory-like domain-containing protein [Arcicella aquatica]MEA5260743.1 carboxypeptidase-like regulatory domain-containing protein [Arcicella aquatica]